ncbi:uncharacterized protein LOC120139470 [Hibiscus syriacus]|uniref:uncharacterized protein LOC120139470 n=1 Tax=Hibiscus syriacus TaxID=106335 RepID=UPI00192149A7|nr:uncharacterized protein LOC120139470 [Hibiscus syriacus]
MAELWAIYYILSYAWNLYFKKVEVETDCLMAVEATHNSSIGSASTIIEMILELLSKNWETKISYIGREGSKWPTNLLCLAKGVSIGVVIHQVPPTGVAELANQDQAFMY